MMRGRLDQLATLEQDVDQDSCDVTWCEGHRGARVNFGAEKIPGAIRDLSAER